MTLEWIDVVIILIGALLSVVGIVGCLLPILPGPPFNYLALLLLHFFTGINFSVKFLIWTLLLAIGVTILDYIVPIVGSKKMGGSSYGIWGSGVGLVLGLLFFPPLGIILGPIVGAWIGELLAGKSGEESLKAAFGSFLGFLAGTLLKLISSFYLTYEFVVATFQIL